MTESYLGPAVLWRLRHTSGVVARATIIPGAPASTLVVFVDDRFERGENFEDWGRALARADEIRRDLEGQGWQAVD